MAPALLRLAPERFRARAFSWNTALLVGSGTLWTAGAGAAATAFENTLSTDRAGGLRAALLLGALATASAALVGSAVLVRSGRGRAGRAIDEASRSSPAGTAAGITSRTTTVATVDAGAASPTHATARRGAGPAAHPRAESDPDRLAIPRGVVLLIVGIGVVWTAGALALPFYNVYFERAHGLGIERIGLILALGQALTAAAVFASGEGAARLGPGRMLTGWLLLFPPVLFGLALAPGTTTATTFYLLGAFVLPAIHPLVDQIVLEKSPRDRQGTVSGWRNIATEGSGLIGATVGGYMLAAGNFTGLFLIAATVALVAGLATVRLLSRLGR